MDAATLLERLRTDGLRLAVAESCTGGRLAATLTGVPGASDVFLGGAVTYDNEAKVRLAHVPRDLIDQNGAVSAAVAEAMAHGIRDALDADLAVAITGIAGPTGATPGKPVGTVWFAALGPGHVMMVHKGHFDGDRGRVQELAVAEALALAMGNVEEWERERVPA